VIFVASGAAASGLSDLLTNRFVLPGSESERAADLLEANFGRKPEGSFTLVVRGEPGSARGWLPPLERAARRAAAVLPTGPFVGRSPVSDRLVSATIVSGCSRPTRRATRTSSGRRRGRFPARGSG
jgi:hypothetical protein